MSVQSSIPSANGTYTLDIGDQIGQVDVVLVCTAPPAAGSVRIQGVTWAGATVQLGGASALSLPALASGPLRAGDFGHFQQLIVTVSGVGTPGGAVQVLVTNQSVAGPAEAYTGYRAQVVQSYVETNTKLGTQFYLRASATLGAGASWSLGFLTGALPVLIKGRDCYARTESLAITLFKGSTYTGGTPIVIQNYNDIAPVTSTVTAAAGVTPTVNGTQWGGSEHIYGESTAGQRSGSSLPPGGDRVLAPNKAYMVTLTNNSSGGGATTDLDYYLTWFEGQPDLPRS